MLSTAVFVIGVGVSLTGLFFRVFSHVSYEFASLLFLYIVLSVFLIKIFKKYVTVIDSTIVIFALVIVWAVLVEYMVVFYGFFALSYKVLFTFLLFTIIANMTAKFLLVWYD